MSTTQPNLRRHGLAFVVAPFVATLTWAFTAFGALVVVDGWTAARNDIHTLVVGAPLIGLPIAIGAVLFLAGPVYAIVEATTTLTRTRTLAAGGLIGAVFATLAGSVLHTGPMLQWVNGAVIGLATAWAWWRIAEGPT